MGFLAQSEAVAELERCDLRRRGSAWFGDVACGAPEKIGKFLEGHPT